MCRHENRCDDEAGFSAMKVTTNDMDPSASSIHNESLKIFGEASSSILMEALPVLMIVGAWVEWLRKHRKRGKKAKSTKRKLVEQKCMPGPSDYPRAPRVEPPAVEFRADEIRAEYQTLINRCVKADDLAGALQHLARLESSNVKGSTFIYNAVMNAHAKRADLAGALDVCNRMRQIGVACDTITYNTLIATCLRSGDPGKAEQYMELMLTEGVSPSVVSFSSVMRACAQAGQGDDVMKWLSKADELGIVLNEICYSAIINAFAKAGDHKSGIKWIEIMMERNATAIMPCFLGVFESALKVKDFESVDLTLGLCQRAGLMLEMGALFTSMIVTAVESKDLARAQIYLDLSLYHGHILSKCAREIVAEAELAMNLTEVHAARIASMKKSRDAVHAQSTAAKPGTTISECEGKRYVGTMKEYITNRFGYITCDELKPVCEKDIFVSSFDNPLGLAKGQRVSFTFVIDHRRGLPRAKDIKPDRGVG